MKRILKCKILELGIYLYEQNSLSNEAFQLLTRALFDYNVIQKSKDLFLFPQESDKEELAFELFRAGFLIYYKKHGPHLVIQLDINNIVKMFKKTGIKYNFIEIIKAYFDDTKLKEISEVAVKTLEVAASDNNIPRMLYTYMKTSKDIDVPVLFTIEEINNVMKLKNADTFRKYVVSNLNKINKDKYKFHAFQNANIEPDIFIRLEHINKEKKDDT